MKLNLFLLAGMITITGLAQDNSHLNEHNIATIIRTEIPPIIDGEMDNIWESSSTNLIDNIIEGIVSDSQDLSAKWSGLWSDTHLYIFVTVTDDKKLMDSPPEHSYFDDQIEIFITTDNKKPKDYWNPKNNNTYAFENPRGGSSKESHKSSVGHIYGQKETYTGWTLELAIPFKDWGINPKEGHKIGIDIQVNDDDISDKKNSDARDAKISWNSLTDDKGGVAFNPLLQGTAIFK